MEITLVKPWGRYPAGAVLTLWRAGELVRPGVVDPARAEQLVADGLAAFGKQAVSAPAAKSGRKRRED